MPHKGAEQTQRERRTEEKQGKGEKVKRGGEKKMAGRLKRERFFCVEKKDQRVQKKE